MYWQKIQHNLTLKEPGHFLIYTFYRRASESLVGPVESMLHWSGGPVGWKCQFRSLSGHTNFLCHTFVVLNHGQSYLIM